ncbi:MAG TPA: cation-transporting P-type ATPase, partial [Kofleriaceae bacterium]
MSSALDERQVAMALAYHARTCRRLRIEVSSLLGNAELASKLEHSVGARPGVVRASANPRSGRMLIEYAHDAAVVHELEKFARSGQARRRSAGMSATETSWHAQSVDVVADILRADLRDGLSIADAAARLDAIGANLIDGEAPPSRLALLARQVTNLPTVLLLGSTVISLLLGDFIDAAAIVTVIGLNAGIGYRVERHSAALLAAWHVAEIGDCEVIRGGSVRRVPSSELVPGDLIIIAAGSTVCADARVIEAHRLAADEAALTGESEPASKSPEPADADAMLADRRSMLYRGTSIASGTCRAIVVATGGATEIASVQRLAAASRAPAGGLERRLAALSSRLAWAGMAAAGLAGLASLAWGRHPIAILRECVALGVAAIPEGLPVTATTTLVRAMAHMRARGVIVRRMATAETLGGVTIACIDKTGTLTENRMHVEVISMLDGHEPRRIGRDAVKAPHVAAVNGPLGALIVAGVLNSDLVYQQNALRLEIVGSATECALVRLAEHAGLEPLVLNGRWPRKRLFERDGQVSYVISEHEDDLECIKGAPEQVVPLCGLPPSVEARVLAENEALASDGLRVLAIGWRAGGNGNHWEYLGLVGLRDPLREGAAEAVLTAASAGIRTVMLTGDQRATAESIARHAGLEGDVIDGRELATLLAAPDAAHRLRRIAAIARVTPADKVAVVEALRGAGEIVAMIGDGINDAPALRAADVGVAVGARSSDLARQTADVVLESEDLRSVLAAVAEGRAVQDNLRRSIRFQAAGNFGEILLSLGTALAGQPLISSLGLLWINLLTDTLPGLALALEPTEAGLLERPPVRPGAPILDREDWKRVARHGAMIAGTSGLAAALGGPLAAFGAVGSTQFGYAATCRAP